MSMRTGRVRSHGGAFPWEETEFRAERAQDALEAVFRLLDAREDDEAERVLNIISDRIHSEGPR